MLIRADQEGNISARKFWHDAFISDIKAIDYAELANGAGVQYTAKGSDNCTMSHCDKGKIQQAVSNLKSENNIAWAWGMFSCAPDGTECKNTLVNKLFEFALKSIPSFYLTEIGKESGFMSMECGKLARIAMEHAKIEANTKQRVPHNYAEMARLLGVTKYYYKLNYLRIYIVMKDSLRDLDRIALPPIAKVVWLIIDKSEGDFYERVNAAIDLPKALRTDARVAA
jgi:hypothetical protein